MIEIVGVCWWRLWRADIQRQCLPLSITTIHVLLLHLPRYHSASQLFANINVPAFQAVIRHLIFVFITRLDKLEIAII